MITAVSDVTQGLHKASQKLVIATTSQQKRAFTTLVSSSWTFTCTDLWKGCVNLSTLLQDLPASSPVFVHQIDLLSPVLQKETSESFYLDEVIIADRAVTGKGIRFFFSFLLMLPSFQDTPLKSLMIRLVETFSRGMVFHNRHNNNFVFLNLYCCENNQEGIAKYHYSWFI